MSYYDDWVDPNGTFRGSWRRGVVVKNKSRKPYECEICGKRVGGLKQHMEDKHPGEPWPSETD
jgi:hypothetical protein